MNLQVPKIVQAEGLITLSSLYVTPQNKTAVSHLTGHPFTRAWLEIGQHANCGPPAYLNTEFYAAADPPCGRHVWRNCLHIVSTNVPFWGKQYPNDLKWLLLFEPLLWWEPLDKFQIDVPNHTEFNKFIQEQQCI